MTLLIWDSSYGQPCIPVKPLSGKYVLNMYYPHLVESKSLTVYEGIENKFVFSKASDAYHYAFETYYPVSIWQDSVTGLIIIKPDTTGGFSFTMKVLNDSNIVVDLYSFGVQSDPLPTPNALFDRFYENRISHKNLDQLSLITYSLPGVNASMCGVYEVESYSIIIIRENDSVYRFNDIRKSTLTSNVKDEIVKCLPGSKIIIDNVVLRRIINSRKVSARPYVLNVE